jgi:hypothetical protein
VSAFARSSLKLITVPRSVEIIGDSCFAGCGFLVCVEFEQGTQISCIGKTAFLGTRISHVLIPVADPMQITLDDPGCFIQFAPYD